MGLLGKIFSAGDRAKRNLLDFVQNPVESVQQGVGHVNDRARGFNELNDAALVETNASGRFNMGAPATSKLAQTLADAYNPIAMTVYHGSPHLFSRFDASKIGTGEGAQAYGHGLYLAETPEVAKMYRNSNPAIDSANIKKAAIQGLSDAEYRALGDLTSRDYAAISDKRFALSPAERTLLQQLSDRQRSMAQQIESVRNSSGNLYTVDLPDEQIAKMLDWDKPLGKQQADVVAGVTKALQANKRGAKDIEWLMNRPGSQVENFLMPSGNRAQASLALRDAGIPGIRYLDGGSRGVGQGTSNFVVFPGNEGLLTILERNGKPIPR
jgi:hypothetical protein